MKIEEIYKKNINKYNGHNNSKNIQKDSNGELYFNIDMGNIANQFSRQDIINKIATKPLVFDGITSNNQKLLVDNILLNSEFIITQQKNELILYEFGKSLMFAFVIDKMPYIGVDYPISATTIGGVVMEAYVFASGYIKVDNIDFPKIMKFYMEKGKAYLEFGYSKNVKDMSFKSIPNIFEFSTQENENRYQFPNNKIPAVIFANNFNSTGDVVEFRTSNLLNEISRQSNWNGPEWNLLKNNIIINRMASGSKSAEQWRIDFSKNNVHLIDDANFNVAANIAPITTDKGTLLQQHNNINWLLDKYDKFMFKLRDPNTSGTNKHNTQILQYNQFALEMLFNKQVLRNFYYTKFFKIIFELSNSLGNIKINIDKIKVNTNMSEMEEIKLKTMEAQAQINKGGMFGNKPSKDKEDSKGDK